MYLLLDIGGTKIRVGTSDGKELLQSKTISTPSNFEEGMAVIKDTALSLTDGKKVKTCIVGIREILNPLKSKLINDPTTSVFPDWIEKPIKKILEQELDTKVFLENDAALAGLGEATWGAGAGKNIVAFITVSTGLGGARITNRRIDQNSVGFEPGELIINCFGELIYLGDITSGHDMEKRYGKKPEEINDKEVWYKVTKVLAVGLYNITSLWSPDVIVLGGSIIKSIDLDILEKEFNILNRKFPKLPMVAKQKLGDLAGLYGAMEYIKQL